MLGKGSTTSVAAPRPHLISLVIQPQTPTGRVVRVIVAAAFVLLGAYSLKLPIDCFESTCIYRKDMLQEYVFARALLDGYDPYSPVATLVEHYLGVSDPRLFTHPSPHPPPASLLFLPFALLPYDTATLVWLGLEVALTIASIVLLARAVGRRLSLLGAVAITVALSAWHPFLTHYLYGQTMILQLLLLAGCWAALRRGRGSLGGALLGLALLVKPVAWPLLFLLVITRQWRGLGWSIGTVLAGYVLSIPVVGWSTVVRYFTEVLPMVAATYRADVGNFSMWTIGWRVFSGTTHLPLMQSYALPLVDMPSAASVASAAVAAVVLLAALWAVNREASFDTQFGMLICTSILVSPIAWSHYMVLAIIPIVQVVRTLAARGWPTRLTNLALLLGVPMLIPSDDWVLLVRSVAGYDPLVAQIPGSFLVSLSSLGPALALGLLIVLLGRVGSADEATGLSRSAPQQMAGDAL